MVTQHRVARTVVCLAAVLSLGGFGSGCVRSAACRAPADTRSTPAAAALPATSVAAIAAAPVPDASQAKPTVAHAKSVPPKSAQQAAAREASALVRTADDAVRASPAGARAWARVEEAQAAYEAALRLDENYRNLAAQQARLDATGPTNALENPMAVSHALSARESVLMRERTDVAQAWAACEQARREYGSLVREDPRFTNATRMMGATETHGGTPKTP